MESNRETCIHPERLKFGIVLRNVQPAQKEGGLLYVPNAGIYLFFTKTVAHFLNICISGLVWLRFNAIFASSDSILCKRNQILIRFIIKTA